MKQLVSFLSLLIVFNLAFSQAQQLEALPDDSRFDQLVEFKTGAEGESLRTMVEALAKSIDLTAVADDVPDDVIIYDIADPKPFRQIWDIVLTLHDLDFVLLDNDVVVVGPSASISKFRSPVETITTDMDTAETEEEILQRFYRVNNDPQDVAAIIRGAVPGVGVDVLKSVNSISVIGTQAQQDRVQSTLDQFDRDVEQVPVEQRIYFLANAVAKDLATVLEDSALAILQDEGDGSQGSPSDFAVTADARTNSIIVTGTAAAQARIAELIPELDTPQQQVNIQVRIQEISTRAASNLGINLTAAAGNLAASILDTGLKFVFDAQNAISGLNLGAVLDTLESQGLSRRVDDSTVTVLNNDTGTIQSGGTIFISIPGADSNIERTIPYGVQVDVTPRIANDGRVTLMVEAKVEDILSESDNPNFLNLSTRQVASTVTLTPGQTVLLGGLLQNQLNQSENRVPVLGDLPIVGSLFGSTTSEEDNTELLLIVTADVIQ